MSKMGQFVFECQEVACELYNEPVEVVKQKQRNVSQTIPMQSKL